MDVEPSVAKKDVDASAPKNKLLVAILGVFGVLIVGLVIAIVVVKNLPKGGGISDADMVEYYSVSNEIWTKIIEENAEMTADEVLALYEKKIEEATDEESKLILTMDYYNLVIMYDVERARKDEVKNAMLAIDEKLQIPLSASNVITMAISYGDQELENKYNEILNERIAAMSNGGETNDTNNTDNNTENSEDTNNEGVGIILYEKANA